MAMKTNKGFDLKAIPWARDIRQHVPLTARQHHVLTYLASRCNPDHETWPSQVTMARDTAIPRETVNRCLRQLESLGLIASESTRPGGSKTYRLCMGKHAVDAPVEPVNAWKPKAKLPTVEEIKAKANDFSNV